MMAAKVFLDTNFLLRALITEMPLHEQANQWIKTLLQDQVEIWINGQVIREFIVQSTHPKTLQTPLSVSETIASLETIMPLFNVADETQSVRSHLLKLIQKYPTQGKQIHDANLVATMLAYEIPSLVTLNVADFKRFVDVIQVQTLPSLEE